MIDYKDQDDIIGNQSTNAHFEETARGDFIPEETIFQIQKIFFEFNQLNPLNTDEKTQKIFSALNDILNSKESRKYLKSVVPFSLYPKILNFFMNTNNELFHLTITRIIEALTLDYTNNLIELLKYNILEMIKDQMKTFKFPNSFEYLLLIISNFLEDQKNERILNQTLEIFPLNFLMEIMKFIKSQISFRDASVQQELITTVLNAWLKCVYFSLSTDQSEINVDITKDLMIEISNFFSVIFGNFDLCKYLIFIISYFIDNDLIDSFYFTKCKYLDFLLELSKNDFSIEIKADSFYLIGKLIYKKNIDRLENCRFTDFFNIILDSDDQKTDQYLLASSIYVCICYFHNENFAREAFDKVTECNACLLDFYNKSKFELKKETIKLLSEYLKMVPSVEGFLPANLPIVLSIANLFFDFIESNEEFEVIGHAWHALITFSEYLSKINQINSPALNDFLSNFYNCMNNLTQSNIEDNSKHAYLMIKYLNELQGTPTS